jgi:DNA-binding IclR family transcriptional regulator
MAKFTARTIVSRRALTAELTAALANGFATTTQEYEDGLNAIAAPVRDHTGAVVAAVSVSGPAYRLDQARMAAIAAGLIAGAQQISEQLGYFGPA